VRAEWEPDELIDAWTLTGGDWDLIANKAGVTRLGFTVMLKFYEIEGRFPAYREEVPQAAVAYLGSLVKVEPALFAKYSWRGRTIEYHRAQIRRAYGTRPPTAHVANGQVRHVIKSRTPDKQGLADVLPQRSPGRAADEPGLPVPPLAGARVGDAGGGRDRERGDRLPAGGVPDLRIPGQVAHECRDRLIGHRRSFLPFRRSRAGRPGDEVTCLRGAGITAPGRRLLLVARSRRADHAEKIHSSGQAGKARAMRIGGNTVCVPRQAGKRGGRAHTVPAARSYGAVCTMSWRQGIRSGQDGRLRVDIDLSAGCPGVTPGCSLR
jgi:hypothetical protein